MKIRPVFAWFDLWVGVFIDRPRSRVFVFPLPCLGFVVELPSRHRVPEALRLARMSAETLRAFGAYSARERDRRMQERLCFHPELRASLEQRCETIFPAVPPLDPADLPGGAIC